MNNTISEKIEVLKNIKNTLKETINNKKDNNIDSDDFIINTNTFDSYASVINDKLTRILPTVEINVNSGNSVMGSVNINGLGKTVSKKFTYNDKCTINAIPKDNTYEFVCWDDGNTDSCRTININSLYTSNISEKTYVATFQDVITPDEPDNPDTPDTPYEDDTLDEPWYFWNGSDSDLNSGKELLFNEVNKKEIIYGEKEDILRNLIIITPKGASISVKLRNALMLDEKIDLDILNPDKETFKKLPSKFISEETVNNYDFTGTSFNEDKLDDNSNLIMTYIEK